MKNILYIIDDKSQTGEFIRRVNAIRAREGLVFYICPVTVDNDLVSRVKQGLSRYGSVEILPFVSEFHANAFKYRDKFIKFLSEFSGGRGKFEISLREYFTHPFGRSSLWWVSLVAEKSPYKRSSYHDFAKLLTIIDFENKYNIDLIYADIQNDALKKAIFRNTGRKNVIGRMKPGKKTAFSMIVAFVKALGYITFFVTRKIILHLAFASGISKAAALKNAEYLFITYFPFADKALLERGIYRNEYLGALQTAVEKYHADRIAWIGITQAGTGLNIKELSLAREINKWGYRLFLPEELVSFWGIAKAMSVFFYTCLKFLIKVRYIRKNFIFGNGKNINIWDLFEEEWIYSFFGSYLASGLIYHQIFPYVISKLPHSGVVIYPSEFYPWENVLNVAREKRKDIKTVGILHASIPLLMLSYFNAPSDLRGDCASDGFPLPYRLGTCGEITRRLFIDSGWPEKRIFNIGAVRYRCLAGFLEKQIEWASRKKQVLVALTSVAEESREMLLMLGQAFKDKDGLTFVIKPHPVPKAFNSLDINSYGGNFVIDNTSTLGDLLVSSRAAVVAGSSVSIESIACQCPVIIPKLSCVADMNPLSGVSEGLARYVTNKYEMACAVRSIVDSEISPVSFDKCRSFIKSYFTMDPDEEGFFNRLEKELGK